MMKHVLGYLRRADEDHGMIKQGDTVAVGVSGGKDSMALLYALHLYKNFSRVNYHIRAFTVDIGFEGFATDVIAQYCASLNIPYTVVKTDIARIVFDERKESNPCALCARMRKGVLFKAIAKEGLHICAFAHHREDCIESLLLSMLYEGRMRTFKPVTDLDRKGITLLRPLIYLPEKEIISAVRRHNIPVAKNPCPASGSTKREETKGLLKLICQSNPNAREMIMTALRNVSQYSLFD